MSVEIASAYVTLIPTATGIQSAIGQELAGTSTVAAAAGKKAGSAFSNPFVKLAVGGAVLKFGKEAVSAASDVAEAGQKVDVVFEDMAGSVQKWAEGSAKAFGISKGEALEAAGTYGNLFRAFGVGLPQAEEMSTTLVQLAGDLASFNNTSVEDALLALRSGLSGETEPLKRYGVALNDARLKEIAAAQGIYDGKGALDAKQKSLAAYELIMKDTALAQGDFVRNGDSFANKTKTMQAQVKDLSANLGTALLPIITKVVDVLSSSVIPAIGGVAEAFAALPSGVQTGIVAFAGIAVGAVLLSKAVGGLSAAFSTLAANPWVLAVLAALALVYAAWRNWDTISAALVAAWNWVYEQAQMVWGLLGAYFDLWWTTLTTAVSTAVNLVSTVIGGGWQLVSDVTSTVWNGISSFLSGVFSSIAGGVDRWIISPINRVIDVFGALPAAASAAWNGVLRAVESVVNAIVSAIDRVRDAASDALGPLGSVLSWGGGVVGGIGDALGFDTGGVVPGPVGQPRLAVVHGGETILPTHKASFERALAVEPIAAGSGSAAGGGDRTVIHVDFRGVTVRDDSDLDAIVRAVNRDKRAQGRVVGGYDSQGLDW